MPRKKIPADLRSLARGHTELCIKVLAGIVSQEAVPASARVSAAGILLDRGWGKAQVQDRDTSEPFETYSLRSRRSRKNRRAKSRKNSVTYGALGRRRMVRGTTLVSLIRLTFVRHRRRNLLSPP